jgi:hypothetical protein
MGRWARNLLVRDVDGHIGFLCVVVGQQTDVGQSPSKDIADDEDSSVLVVAGDVGLVLAECGLFANGLAIPLESFFATGRHDVCDVVYVCEGEEVKRGERRFKPMGGRGNDVI